MKRKTAFSVSVFGILIVLGYYFFGMKPKMDYAQATVTLGGKEFRADIADTIATQALGLSGRAGLREDEGMLFVFGTAGARSFWMKDMNFPIDIIWVKGSRVVGFAERAEPEPGKNLFQLTLHRSPEPVDKVFEVSAGTVARLGIQNGDTVVIQ
jgi:uncharacterized membrane protein (UPF0127 family)